MHIGLMTSAFRKGRSDDPFTTYKEQIRMCKEAGYTVLDLNMCAMITSDTATEFQTKDWRVVAEDTRQYADSLGVTFSQSHPVYRKVPGGVPYPDKNQEDRYLKLAKLGIELSAIMGVKWAVLHPAMAFGEAMLDEQACIRINHEANDGIIDLAIKRGVGIAYENMRDNEAYRRFGSSAEELVSLVDDYHCPEVGVCWDFGHAHRNMQDQCRALRLVGRRLKATHLNDNHGKDLDEHLIPFMGTISWERIMKVLRDIGYEGPLVYELSATANMPMPLKMETMKYAKTVGDYLLSLGV